MFSGRRVMMAFGLTLVWFPTLASDFAKLDAEVQYIAGLVVMAIGFVMVIGGFIFTNFRGDGKRADE